MAETREQMAARLEDYADAWANEGTPDADALRAGAAALRAQGWQDISTAPTNAAPVLCYFGMTAGDDWSDIAVAAYKRGKWRLCEGSYDVVDEPTHWMPLPSPPETV